MLKNIILGRDRSKFVLIKDSVELPAIGLLKAFVMALADRHYTIHVFLYEMTPRNFMSGFPASVVEKLQIQEMSGDPFGWISGTASFDILQLQSKVPQTEQKTALVIDSLTSLIKANSSAAVCRLMCQLAGRFDSLPHSQTFEQIVSVVHKDVLDAAELRAVEHSARCVVDLLVSADLKAGVFCRTSTVSENGKLSASNECFSITDSFGFESMSIPVISKSERQKPVADPTSNLTFRLTLREEEEKAKREVVLPYLSAQRETQAECSNNSSKEATSSISDEEFFEDEDPDDDLDI